MNKHLANNAGSVKTLYGKNDTTDYYRRVQQIPLVNSSAAVGINKSTWNKEVLSRTNNNINALVISNGTSSNNNSSSSGNSNSNNINNSSRNSSNSSNTTTNFYWNNNNTNSNKPSSAFGIRKDDKRIAISNTNERSNDNNNISIITSDQRKANENMNNNNNDITNSNSINKKQVRFADEIAQYSDGINNKPLAIGLRGVQGIAPSLRGSIRAQSASMATRPVRPSLSEQLATIGAKAEAITLDIRQKNGLESAPPVNTNMNQNIQQPQQQQPVQEGLLFTVPAKQFSVGTLSCRYPSPISFYKDRCEYAFAHPFKSLEVQMVMYYRDMRNVSITGQSFRFRIPKRMAIFPTDYDPSNMTHNICIDFMAGLAMSLIREKIVPSIHLCTSGSGGSAAKKINYY